MVEYQGMTLPKKLIQLIDMDKLKEKGFSSKTDFVKQAIRNELHRVKV